MCARERERERERETHLALLGATHVLADASETERHEKVGDPLHVAVAVGAAVHHGGMLSTALDVDVVARQVYDSVQVGSVTHRDHELL